MNAKQLESLSAETAALLIHRGELFEAPFNLAGESQSSELTAEGEARVRALAESEARKAQLDFDLMRLAEREHEDGFFTHIST